MADKIIENNQVSMMGKIVAGFTFSHQVFGEVFYMTELLVKRLSDSEYRIPVMVSERLVDVTQDYIGEYVEIHGQFRSYNRHEEKHNRLVLSVFSRELKFEECFRPHWYILSCRQYSHHNDSCSPGQASDDAYAVDDSQTEVLELNDTNDAGIGLKSVIRTPYELTVNELYKEGSNSDCFMVALDANGNTLPYNESTGNCNNFAIQDRDISTVDIYFLDYVQYMDELKGQQNFDNPTKEDGQKWKKLLEENAKYHKTLHFDNDNVKN